MKGQCEVPRFSMSTFHSPSAQCQSKGNKTRAFSIWLRIASRMQCFFQAFANWNIPICKYLFVTWSIAKRKVFLFSLDNWLRGRMRIRKQPEWWEEWGCNQASKQRHHYGQRIRVRSWIKSIDKLVEVTLIKSKGSKKVKLPVILKEFLWSKNCEWLI